MWQLQENLPAASLVAHLTPWAVLMLSATLESHSMPFRNQRPNAQLLFAAAAMHTHRLTDSQITDNILLLLFAGHDTSSTTLTQCLSNLQDCPEVLSKLRAEQAAVVAKHGEQITAAALKDMHYAEAVIR